MEKTNRNRRTGGETRRGTLRNRVALSEDEEVWSPIEGAPTFPGLQDTVTILDEKVILGGVAS